MRLRVAATVASRRLELTSQLWSVKNNKTSAVQKYGLPDLLDPKFINQLLKVYTTCIHPTQYLPLLFTQENASLILQSGRYIAEKLQDSHLYTLVDGTKVAQHCRHMLIPGNLVLY